MAAWQRVCTVSSPLLTAVGILFGSLPRNCIELQLGIDPDGGSGLVEFLLTAVLISIGVAFGIYLSCQLPKLNVRRRRQFLTPR